MGYKVAINTMQLTGKLPAGDSRWAKFNDSFVNQHIEMLDLINAIYTGYAYTTWHNGRRSIDNFICGQHIAIDMDTGDERSSFDVLKQHEFVRSYASFLHTTPSHTSKSPRARIVFLLDTCIGDAARYQTAAKFLVNLFDGADTACTDASRFFYGSPDCDIEIIGNSLPLEHLRWYYSQHKDKIAQPQTTKAQDEKQPETKVVEEPDKLAEVESALKHVDPWAVDYNTWIGILAAMKREGVPMSVAKEWALGKDGEVEREWERLRNERGKKMTLRSVFRIAYDNGWHANRQH